MTQTQLRLTVEIQSRARKLITNYLLLITNYFLTKRPALASSAGLETNSSASRLRLRAWSFDHFRRSDTACRLAQDFLHADFFHFGWLEARCSTSFAVARSDRDRSFIVLYARRDIGHLLVGHDLRTLDHRV